jgi:hypothetical protein
MVKPKGKGFTGIIRDPGGKAKWQPKSNPVKPSPKTHEKKQPSWLFFSNFHYIHQIPIEYHGGKQKNCEVL